VGPDKDLRLTLEWARAEPPDRPIGALLFTCNGREWQMFGVADHDAVTI
jgi:small ligand-binding sensory domain FIST